MVNLLLKVFKRMYAFANPDDIRFGRNWHMFPNKSYSSNLLCKALSSDKPCMIARLGSTELQCMINYLGVKQSDEFKSIKGFISNRTPPWWWNKSIINQMQNWSGFFPAKIEYIEQFCQLMISELPNVDVLGSWLKEESFFSKELAGAKKVMLEDLEPFFCCRPWTRALAGKKVLVVHPFAETILSQYEKRRFIFPDGLLPEFSLEVISAVQSLGGHHSKFSDWFAALDHMKSQIGKANFDICILGCGAYGFPLAAHVKRLGRHAVHLGGVTQLLFGIKGKRWEQFIVYPYSNLFNEHWVRPNKNETPEQSKSIEDACYW